MNLLEIIVDKDRNLEVKNSPKCTVGDLMCFVGCFISEISNQTGKSTKTVFKELKRLMKKGKVWKK